LGIGCNKGGNYGNIRVNLDNGEVGEFVVGRENAIFATDYLTFETRYYFSRNKVFNV